MKDATDNIAYAMEVLAKTADLDFDLYQDVMIIFFHLWQLEEKELFLLLLTYIQKR